MAIDITTRGVSDATELEPAIVTAAREPGTALIVFPDIFTGAHHEQIVALAEQYKLPAIYPFRFFAAGGGLMSYGIDTPDLFRRTALATQHRLPAIYPYRVVISTTKDGAAASIDRSMPT